ncbi:MAG: type II secretion system protein GspD, partial [Candidatus Omnitrophica bacterium]|nr:type II secretion system protein GspD [Candidatus Omnitrophota bacterium]
MKKAIFTLLVLLTFSLSANSDTSEVQIFEPLEEAGSEQAESEQGGVKTLKISPKSSLSQGLAEEVSLDLRGIDIVEVIKFLSMKGNFNIVTTSDVQGKVTLFLKNVAISDVLDIILLINNLACEKKDNIITIMTESEYEAIYGEPYKDNRILKVINLKYANVSNLLTVLSNIKSDIGKVISDSTSGTLLLIDVPVKIKEMEELAKKLDLPTINRILPVVTEVFELSYAKAVDLEPKISLLLSEGVGSIRMDERTNTIIVTDLPHSLEEIKKTVRAFDAKDRQVLIEAKIVDVVLSDDYYAGIDWSAFLSRSKDFLFDGTFPFGSTGASSLAVSIGELATDDFEFALTLIKSVGDARIVAAPHIIVCSGEEATFMVGTREAYVTSTITTGEVVTTTSESVEFIDTGTTLYVTPVINKDGFVKMHIKPEVSSVKEWLETTEGNKIPIVDTSNVETEVLIKDGKTVIIAGLIREAITKVKRKVPFLGDLPLIGFLFRNISDEKQKRELIIFL